MREIQSHSFCELNDGTEKHVTDNCFVQIEKQLEKLLETIGGMDEDFVAQEESKRDKERRDLRREQQHIEKEKEQMLKMAERQKRAAQPVKKKTGKPLMTRHMQDKRKKRDDVEVGNTEEEDIKEFFM